MRQFLTPMIPFFAVAMKAMNKVASHINEMQKIHEEFGAVFDQLITEQSSEKKEVLRINKDRVLSTKTSEQVE